MHIDLGFPTTEDATQRPVAKQMFLLILKENKFQPSHEPIWSESLLLY